MQFTPLPNLFFSNLLPQINDIDELKITIYILWAFYQRPGYPRFVTYRGLLGNKSLMSGLKKVGESSGELLRRALDMATKRGTILHMVVEENGVTENIYFLNTESDRQVMAKIQSGELFLGRLKAGEQDGIETEELPDVFTLYEQNLGMLTPIISEELREAEKLYPKTWIKDAIKEAVNQNTRKWSYVSAILERWSSEGRSNGARWRHSKTDPNKYVKGRYGHMVRR